MSALIDKLISPSTERFILIVWVQRNLQKVLLPAGKNSYKKKTPKESNEWSSKNVFFIVKCTVVSLMSKLVSLKARCIKTVLSGLLNICYGLIICSEC